MIKNFRVWLARKILGNHCACYQMGYHHMVDFQKLSEDRCKTRDQNKIH